MDQTLNDLLIWGKETLRSAEIDDYDISAELLLRSLLKLTRSQLILRLNNPIPPEIKNQYINQIARRASRMPLQYLIGEVDFYNIKLVSDARALIPRPETEILVETVLKRIEPFQSPKILDIGTGSGNIAVAIARNAIGSNITGIDISREALDLAAKNARLNKVDGSIDFVPGDIFDLDFVRSLGLFDCVVSNPPYVSEIDKDDLQPEIAKFEPAIAVFAGNDPLIFYKTIIADISYILRTGGLLAFEVGLGQANTVSDLMASAFKDITISKDLAGIDRVVTGVYAGIDKR